MRSDGSTVGSLSAFSRSAGQKLGEAEIEELERLAFRAGPALENARKYSEARALADLDALTGLHNRRFFHETLAREVARAQRYHRELALIVFDLDDFKAINDRIGHLAGDAVLAEAAERMLTVVRSADIACRVGGDEFAVVLPESNGEEAELLAGPHRARDQRAADHTCRHGHALGGRRASCGRPTARPISSSGPTKRSTGQRSSARRRRTSRPTARRALAEAEVRRPVGQVDRLGLRRLVVLAGQAAERLVLAAANPGRERARALQLSRRTPCGSRARPARTGTSRAARPRRARSPSRR